MGTIDISIVIAIWGAVLACGAGLMAVASKADQREDAFRGVTADAQRSVA